jgi:prepilin-type N-terminal cleavage/methylation domain-containing protein
MRLPLRLPSASRGFTLLEFVVVLAIIAILAGVAVAGYQQYMMRARGTEIVAQYDALRTGVASRAQSAEIDDCLALASNYGTGNLSSPYATLGYGFEAVPGGGYRPVLSVCARADSNGALNIKVARGVYDTLSRDGVVEANPVLSDSVVSFALRLTDESKAVCSTYTSPTAATCAQAPLAVAQPPAVATNAQPPAVAANPQSAAQTLAPAQIAAPDQTSAPAQSTAVPALTDTYPTCAADFDGMCDREFVRGMCEKTCAGFQQPTPAQVIPSPDRPRAPDTPRATRYPTQTSISKSGDEWISACGATSPDGSPMRLVGMSVADPAFAKASGAQGSSPWWDVDLLTPPNSGGSTTITLTIENRSGQSTCTFTIRR